MIRMIRRLWPLLGLVAAVGPVAAASPWTQTKDARVQRFLEERCKLGVPFAEARELGTAAVGELQRLLADPAEEARASRIVTVLGDIGDIGDPSAVAALTEYLDGREGSLSTGAFEATLLTLPALGMLARDEGDQALQVLERYVRAGSDPSTLRFRNGPYQGTVLAEVLGRYAILGLGLSGRTEAESALRDAQQLVEAGALPATWRSSVARALDWNPRVRAEGLAKVAETERLPQPAPRPGVRALVTEHYPAGLPYTQAQAFGPAAVTELAAILSQKELESYWTNAVQMLGFLAEPAGVPVLMDFFSARHGELSVDAFRAILLVPQALGFIANRDDRQALDLLSAFAREVGSYPQASYGHYEGDELREALGRVAVQGLGLSGKPEALAVLQSLMADGARESWSDNLQAAIELHVRVNSEGIAGIYEGGAK